MRETFNAHGAAVNLNNLANFVLAFGNECESHGLPFKYRCIGLRRKNA